jgi:hypothetical protein
MPEEVGEVVSPSDIHESAAVKASKPKASQAAEPPPNTQTPAFHPPLAVATTGERKRREGSMLDHMYI